MVFYLFFTALFDFFIMMDISLHVVLFVIVYKTIKIWGGSCKTLRMTQDTSPSQGSSSFYPISQYVVCAK